MTDDAPLSGSKDLPAYIRHTSEHVLSPPYTFHDATLYAFLLKTSTDQLNTLLKAHFPPEIVKRYNLKARFPFVACVFGYLDRGASVTDADKGILSECDAAFTLAVEYTENNETHVGWYTPYIFVDTDYPMAMGREVYGMNKGLGWFSFPGARGPMVFQAAPRSPEFQLETVCANGFSNASRWDRRPLFRVDVSDLTQEAWVFPVTAEVVVEKILGAFSSVWSPEDQQDLSKLLAIGNLVFLKQFRDAQQAGKACFQAFTTTKAGPLFDKGKPSGGFTFYGASPDKGLRPTLHVDARASHPIAKDLFGAQEGLAFDAKALFSMKMVGSFQIG